MKVYVYNLLAGGQSVMVVASPGRGLSPVLLEAVSRENIQERLLPVIAEMRRIRDLPVSVAE